VQGVFPPEDKEKAQGILDVLAARLLALMLLLFDALVEIAPVFIRLHDQGTWGGCVIQERALLRLRRR
jgi:hypothetical protein